MAVVLTFTTLQSQVQSYLERGTVNDQKVYGMLPTLINNAERRISSELQTLGFLVPANFTFQAGVSVYPKPDRWRETASMNVGAFPNGVQSRVNMFIRSYEYIRTYWPNETATPYSLYGQYSPPLFYADYDYQHWVVAPTPDQAYQAEVNYYEEPALLDASNQVNWITEYKPQLLLYATLLEAAPFLKNDSRISTWQSMYDRIAGVTSGEDKNRVLDRNTTRQKD